MKGLSTRWDSTIQFQLHFRNKYAIIISIKLVTKLGFEPIAFELPTMRVEPGVHSHEACVLAVDLSDILILIVDKRVVVLTLR
jgi:hypothetical protein